MKLEFDGKAWKIIDETQLYFYEIKTPKGYNMTIINEKTIIDDWSKLYSTPNPRDLKALKVYENCIPIVEENTYYNEEGKMVFYIYFLDINCQKRYGESLDEKDTMKLVLEPHKKLLEYKVLKYDKIHEQQKLITTTCHAMLNILEKLDLYHFLVKTESNVDKKESSS